MAEGKVTASPTSVVPTRRRALRDFRRSCKLVAIRLPDPRAFQARVSAMATALLTRTPALVQYVSQQIVTELCNQLKVPPVLVCVTPSPRPLVKEGCIDQITGKVTEVHSFENHGLYTPDNITKGDARIQVWMFTAVRHRVVSYKTFLRTLLHEFCHHYDYEALHLQQTFHTPGFFARESSLFRLATSLRHHDDPAREGAELALQMLREIEQTSSAQSDLFRIEPEWRKGQPQVNIVLRYFDIARARGNREIEEGFASLLTDYISSCVGGAVPDLAPYDRVL